MTSVQPRQSDSSASCCSGCGTSRRSFLERGATLGALGAVSTLGLAACTDDIRAEESAPSHHAGGSATEAVKTEELPVGESTSVTVEGVTLLLHRDAEDSVRAFSATCTHQGCTVAPTEENGDHVFACPCHGSHFDVTTGVPYGGPAKKPLTEYTAAVDGDRITVEI
ncbi:ubiquinol-cytochrome c reductase iron-sulfur subunit [Citricoccus sp. GCM10030269]|uniref:QcrA and Rieske domain-containing protein n=1 Tax=Citricoccus sp. GCM10030269 TaxID=3273388 RepID=UPI00360B87C0